MNAAAAPAAAEFAAATVEREIAAACLVDFGGGHEQATVTALPTGAVAHDDSSVTARFLPGSPVVELRIALPEPVADANGVSAALRLDGWKTISYLAVGHSAAGGFAHVKCRHPLQGTRTPVTFSHTDLIYAIQNPTGGAPAGDVSDVRVYLKAEAEESGGTITVFWAAAWRAETGPVAALEEADASQGVLTVLRDYLRARNDRLQEHAREYLSTGRYPVTGDVVLEWPVDQALPTGLEEDATYRYIWHSLYPAAHLALYGLDTGDTRAYQAALSQVTSWLERSYYGVDPDPRYAWYDHGTAERLIALLVIAHTVPRDLIEPRLARRLGAALLSHAQLLESEAFYAANQRTRFHNHAWFQDLALLAASALLSTPAAPRWADFATSRLRRQVGELVCWDSDYAVFVENSIGYHQGIESLVRVVSSVLEAATDDTSLHEVLDGLGRWSAVFRYADGRAPSQGDTFRIPNGPRRFIRDVEPAALILPSAGYGLAHGSVDGRPFTITLLATSLSETHKHADNLALAVYYDAVEWLIDPSFYSHAYAEPIPAYLRGPWAHNALVVEGADYSIAAGSSELRAGPEHRADHFHAVGHHTALGGYRVERSVVTPLDALRLDVIDRIGFAGDATPSVRACIVFHLGEGVAAEVAGTRAILRHPESNEQLELTLPRAPRVVSGWHGAENNSSVAGTSFQRHLPTDSLLLDVTVPSSTPWRLARVDE